MKRKPVKVSRNADSLPTAVVFNASGMELIVVDGQQRTSVGLQKVGPWLRAHVDTPLVCANAGDLHLLLTNALRQAGDQEGTQNLWDLSARGHLYDVELLRDLVQLASGEAVASDGALQKGDHSPESLLSTYTQLQTQAAQICERLNVDPDLASRFGPLGLAHEVRGRIAARCMKAGRLRIFPEAREELLAACRNRRDTLVGQLCEHHETREIFQQDTKEDWPKFRKARLRAWLEQAGKHICDLHGVPVGRPCNRGHVYAAPPRWGQMETGDPLVEAWIALVEVRNLHESLQRLRGETIEPQYDFFKGVRDRGSELERMRLLRQEPIFYPADDHSFLLIRLEGLQFRALAATLESSAGPSQIGTFFREGVDAFQEVARRLATHVEKNVANKLVNSQVVAETVLNRATLGFSPVSVHARLTRAGQNLSLLQVMGSFCHLYNEIFPELYDYLRIPLASLLARRMGITAEQCIERWEQVVGPDFNGESICKEFFFGNGQRSDTSERIRYFLAMEGTHRSNRAEWDKYENENEFFQWLTSGPMVTPTGKVYAECILWESLGKEHMHLADAVKVRCVYELLRCGVQVRALIGETIIAEYSTCNGEASDGEDARAIVDGAMQRAFAALLGDVPGQFSLEIADQY
jgi:hypothetical protein